MNSQEINILKALQNAIEAHRLGKLQDAERLYRAILQVQVNHPEANHNLGVLAVQAGNPEEGLPYFKLALETNPKCDRFWISFADAFVRADRINDAASILTQGQAFGLHNDTIEVINIIIKNYATTNNLEIKTKAANLINKQYSCKNYYEAERLSKEFIQNFPNDIFGYKALGSVLIQCNKSVEAIDILTNALKLANNDPVVHSFLGVLFQESGKYEKAFEHYKKALEINPDSPEIYYNMGLAFQETGKYEKAFEHYKKALKINSYSPETYNNMGIVLQILGKHKKALSHYKKALQIKPDYAEVYNNMGNVLHLLGKHDNAFKQYIKALEIKPDYVEAYCNIGSVLNELGKHEEALAQYKTALKIKPDHAEAYNNMGNLFKVLGKQEEALTQYKEALKIKPDYPEAYYNLGLVYQESCKHEIALDQFKKALKIKTDYVEAYCNMGSILKDLGKHEEALVQYKIALEIKPDYFEVYNNIGILFQELGNHEEALVNYKKALEIKPDYAEAYNNIGNVFHDLGKYDEALEQYKIALKLKGYYAQAYSNIGNVLQDLGKIGEALAMYKKALEIKHDYAEAYYATADIKQFAPDNSVFVELNNILSLHNYSDKDKMIAHFALGKNYSKLKNYSRAFYNFSEAHKYRYKINNYKSLKYDHDSKLNALIFFRKIFTPEFFIERSNWGSSIETPIFIVGFPRSGTSLVEQILASHSQVFGAGELKDISNLIFEVINFKKISNQEHLINLLDQSKILHCADKYLLKINQLSNFSKYVTDKMPHNFEKIWFIKLIFPKAKILHCVRSPEDTCLSCYFNKFVNGHEYIDDLQDLAKHYKYYLQMMSFWKSVIPAAIHDISYEKLVSDPEHAIRNLLSICNLDFEKQCLEFYNTNRAVKTASATQVREKMYTSSVGSWKKYQKFLGPLLDELHNNESLS